MSDQETTIAYELVRTATLVSFRILDEEVEPGLDEGEFSLRVQVQFTADEDEDEPDEGYAAESTAEWGALAFMFVLAMLSFADARPRNASVADYREKDRFTVADFLERFRFRRGALHFEGDYIRGRRIKTYIAAHANGVVRIDTVGRGKAALRWLNRLQGKKFMQVVAGAADADKL